MQRIKAQIFLLKFSDIFMENIKKTVYRIYPINGLKVIFMQCKFGTGEFTAINCKIIKIFIIFLIYR